LDDWTAPKSTLFGLFLYPKEERFGISLIVESFWNPFTFFDSLGYSRNRMGRNQQNLRSHYAQGGICPCKIICWQAHWPQRKPYSDKVLCRQRPTDCVKRRQKKQRIVFS